jgi:hypothetical protein
MPLQKLTLDRMSCFVIDFPLLSMIEYPQTPFAVAKVSPYWVQQNTLSPLFTLWPYRYSHTYPAHPTRQIH